MTLTEQSTDRTCDGCGVTFAKPPKLSARQWAVRRFCSADCYNRNERMTDRALWCRRCERERTREDFRVKPDGTLKRPCKDCIRASQLEYVAHHRAETAQRNREWRQRNLGHENEYQRERRRGNADAFNARQREKYALEDEAKRERRREAARAHRAANRARANERARDERARLRREAFDHYGWACACCGEDGPEFLTIDHINNDGANHRAAIGNASIPRWLKKNGFPEGFQTLCFNCNCAKGIHGVCPHERQRA